MVRMSDNGNDIKIVMREFFKNNFLYSSDIDSISDDTSFMNEGIIDSTGVLELLDFIEERFGAGLEFGTAGLRGIIAAGTNRMNIYTVRKASLGLARFVNKN
ncbi:MAG: hypothetical protein ACMUHU_01215, partial [Thermoplasmatota archaeon]